MQQSSPFHDGLIVKFDIITDRDSAERWRGRYLLVPSDELTPPGDDEVFVHDLIGMRVASGGRWRARKRRRVLRAATRT